jgi:hypothetical protein
MTTVYIVNQAGHDFSTAAKFGKLESITEGNINIARPDRDLFNIGQKVKEIKEDDLILLSGNILINVMVISALLTINKFKTINLLIYDAKLKQYIKHSLSCDSELKFIRE